MGSRPIVVYAFLLTGVISMVGGYGCSEGVKYETYVSKDPKLNVTMPYIKGWSFRESRGSYDSYAQVVFYQPQDNDKSRKAGIILTVKESAKVAFSPLTIEACVEDVLAKRMKLKDAKVLIKSKTKLLGAEAVDITLSYLGLDKPYSTDAKLIAMKERMIICQKADAFYFLRYENTEARYPEFEKAFGHIAKSVRFQAVR